MAMTWRLAKPARIAAALRVARSRNSGGWFVAGASGDAGSSPRHAPSPARGGLPAEPLEAALSQGGCLPAPWCTFGQVPGAGRHHVLRWHGLALTQRGDETPSPYRRGYGWPATPYIWSSWLAARTPVVVALSISATGNHSECRRPPGRSAAVAYAPLGAAPTAWCPRAGSRLRPATPLRRWWLAPALDRSAASRPAAGPSTQPHPAAPATRTSEARQLSRRELPSSAWCPARSAPVPRCSEEARSRWFP